MTTSARYSLIQMSSDQTMQNVLPALALRPERVVQVVSGRFKRPESGGPDPLVVALRLGGVEPEFGDVRLEASHPTHFEVFQTIYQVIVEERNAGRTPVVNLTGGSKLMSIGAFAAASQGGAHAVYVDTPQMRFVIACEGDAQSLDEVRRLLDFSKVMERLNIDLIAQAHGARLDKGQDWRRHLPLARSVQQYARDIRRALGAGERSAPSFHKAFFPAQQICPKHEDVDGWIRFWNEECPLPTTVATEALKLGYVIRVGESFRLSPGWMRPQLDELARSRPGPTAQQSARDSFQTRANEVVQPAQDFLNLIFGGSWLEVITAESLSRQPDVRDVRWSAGELDAGGTRVGEHDIVALWHGRLVHVSCKVGRGQSKLPLAISDSASTVRRLGGILAAGVLCTDFFPDTRRQKAIADRAKKDHVVWVTTKDLGRNDWFKPGL